MGLVRVGGTPDTHPDRRRVNPCFTNPGTWEMHFVAALNSVETSAAHARSFQLVEKRLCRYEIGGGEALGEPAVDRGEQVAGCSAPVAP
jgi:hypothetical protein